MTQHWFGKLVLPALVVGCVASSAKAELVTTFIGTSPSQQVNLTATRNGQTRSFESPVGPFNFIVLSDTSNTGLGPTFRSFCGDFFQDVAVGNNYVYTPGNLIDLPDVSSALQVRKLDELYEKFYDVATDAEKGAAFQLAVWEILSDPTNTNLSTGNFIANGPGSPSSITVAQGWLNSITGDDLPTVSKYRLTALLTPSAQDQIVVSPNPVPAPAGAVLLVIGAAGLIARRKFAKKGETTEATEEAKA